MILNKKKSTIMTILAMFILCLNFMTIPVLATTNETVSNMENTQNLNNMTSNTTVDADAGLQKADVRQIQAKVNEKTFDVVHILQTFGKPFAGICFIAAALYSMVALLMKNGSLGKGCLAMFICAVVYGLIAQAPQIVQMISNWIQS